MKYAVILALAIAAITFFSYNQTQNLQQGLPTYKFITNKDYSLTRIQKVQGNYGEDMKLEKDDDGKPFQQTFILLNKGQDADVFRFVMVGDKGESLALTAYPDTDDVFVKVNLIEDKLNKWWKVTTVGDDKFVENTAPGLSKTFLCGNKVKSTSSDSDCKWRFVESDLPL